MKRVPTIVTVLLALAACSTPDNTAPVRSATTSPVFDPALNQLLSLPNPVERVGVLVSYDAAATNQVRVAAAVLRTGAGVVGFLHLPVVYALATPAQLTSIASIAGVQRVTQNRALRWYGSPMMLHESLPTIRADEAHRNGITGSGVGVAILDSGIDGLYNPDLTYPTKTVQNIKVVVNVNDLLTFGDSTDNIAKAGRLFVENLPNSETSVGHGTHVAGIVGSTGTGSSGYYKGVAPGAKLVGIGTGDILFIFWALAGFDYILEHQAQYNIKVVNNSWGSAGAFDANDPTNQATKMLHDRGITVVFASGNDGPDQNTLNMYSVAPWVIGVAAGCKLVTPDPTNSAADCADPTGQRRAPMIGGFSSRGIPGDALYHPTITAPGVRIVSTRASTGTVLNGLDLPSDVQDCAIATGFLQYYTCASGTSMATPHIVGVVALMQEAANQSLTPDQVKTILTNTARPIAGYALWEVGAGYVDAWAAVLAAAGR